MTFVQSLTPEDCFRIHLLKVKCRPESLRALFVTPELVWKPIRVQYSTKTSVLWKPEASSAQTLRIDFGDIFYEVVKHLKCNIFAYS